MNSKDALALMTIAEVLANYEIDNGPNGSDTPFTNEARTLRRIAMKNAAGAVAYRSGDFRDLPDLSEGNQG